MLFSRDLGTRMLQHILLSLLIWVPMIGGLLCLLMGRSDTRAEAVRWVATTFALITLALCIPLYMDFNAASWHMQFVEFIPWIPAFNINYSLGVDGISVLFIILTCFTNLIVVLSSWRVIKKNVAQFMAVFLFSCGIMNGGFEARDAILFYIFYEASMIPMFLGIGIWGGKRKSYASIKFFLYTFLGSVFMLVAFMYLYSISGTFNIASWEQLNIPASTEDWLFLGFLAAFAVKIPMWPLHTWLPDAHTEAPSGGSVVLAALMLKMGAYGFLRFNYPILPNVTSGADWFILALSLIAIIYVGFASLAQKDIKRLIAYSSISHMGLVTLGIFIVYMIFHKTHNTAEAMIGVQGAVFQMISHAFSSGAMFIGVGYMFDRFGSRLMQDYKGLAYAMPIFAAFYMLFAMANVGLPGTSGFVGEFLIIMAAFKANIWLAFGAALTVVIAPAYTLWMFKRVLFGDPTGQKHEGAKNVDIKGMDFIVFFLLAVPVLVFGFYPSPILNISHAAVAHFTDHVVSRIPIGAY